MASAPESVTAAAAASSSSSVSLNINYLTSPGGILKIMEFVFGLICWAPIAAIIKPSCHVSQCSAYQFVMFVSITAWILTL